MSILDKNLSIIDCFAYYLNEYFFEGAISFKEFLEQGDNDVGLFNLPRERDGVAFVLAHDQ